MKVFTRYVLTLILFLLVTGTVQAAPRIKHVEVPDSILFVGNSFTFYNNSIHSHLRALLTVTDPGLVKPDSIKSMTISGARLVDHKAGLNAMLGKRRWGVVVLQGHSLEAINGKQASEFRTTAEVFARAVRKSGAEPVFFMTWAYADQPEMTGPLNKAYTSIGNRMGALVVPVGLAFERARNDIPGVQLIVSDRKHPTLEGTYLAACVFYAAVYGKSPVEIHYSANLEAGLARKLRVVAWETTQIYYGENP